MDLGGEASAEAKGGDSSSGGGGSAEGMVGKEIETYQITDAGAILAATISGGKFSRDADLN